MDAMEFVVKFLKHYDTVGIYDEFDDERNKMVTSKAVYQLVQDARGLMPKKIKPRDAASQMEGLTDEERDQLIADAGRKVADLRHQFSRKIAENGGTRAILERITDALEVGDETAFTHALTEAKVFTLAEREGDAVFAGAVEE